MFPDEPSSREKGCDGNRANGYNAPTKQAATRGNSAQISDCVEIKKPKNEKRGRRKMAKLCVEFGEIVTKEVIAATEKRIWDGKEIEAQPERYRVLTLSGADKTKEDGYISPTLVSHYLEKAEFDSYKPGDKVKVRYNYNGDDKAKVSKGIEKIGG